MSAFGLEYSIDIDEKSAVAYVKIYGLWKADVAERYRRDFVAEVEPLLGKPWARLVDLTSWRTSYEDVILVIGKHMEWCWKNGAELQLYVLNNPSTFRQLNRMFEKGEALDISHTFRTYAEAEKFLKENWIDKRR